MLSEWADNRKKVADGMKLKTEPQLSFTDDTAMARSIAASIIDNKSVNVEDIAARFVWFSRPPVIIKDKSARNSARATRPLFSLPVAVPRLVVQISGLSFFIFFYFMKVLK